MFEESVPATTPKYRYQGIEQCLDIMTKEHDRYEGKGGNPYVITFGVDDLDRFVNLKSLLSQSLDTCNYFQHCSAQDGFPCL